MSKDEQVRLWHRADAIYGKEGYLEIDPEVNTLVALEVPMGEVSGHWVKAWAFVPDDEKVFP
jgi:hypothetical protein